MPWEDAKIYCESSTVPAALAKMTSGRIVRAVYEYVTQYQIKGSFWLGASDLEVEDDWVWLDMERVNRGTPFWAVHSNLIGGWSHEPSGGKDENCLVLDEQRLYYFNDESCDKLYHPLCQEL
ncbi:C-type lectin mannose-binding isoform-like [Palaemon carinicauda]|uniref:C-type lectin mannose-binding isoform-like n=1 Tax=Palaemon carinicauda TaxID=392227 RepID=UPI0035B5CC20